MPKPGVTVDSVKTRKALAKMRKDTAGEAVNRKAGQAVLNAALGAVPVKSGKLKQSGRLVVLTDGSAVIFGGGPVLYADVINWGWPSHSIRASLFLQAQVTEEANAVHNVYADDVEKQVKRVDRTS